MRILWVYHMGFSDGEKDRESIKRQEEACAYNAPPYSDNGLARALYDEGYKDAKDKNPCQMNRGLLTLTELWIVERMS